MIFARDWSPICKCRADALEPNEDCWLHGAPDRRRCPNCGAFRSYNTACNRCGCAYGVTEIQGPKADKVFVDEGMQALADGDKYETVTLEMKRPDDPHGRYMNVIRRKE